MSITFRPRYIDYVQTEPDIGFYINQTPIPSVNDQADWTLNLFTWDGTHLDGSNIAVGASAERFIPGLVAGHLYKLRIRWNSQLDPLNLYMGGVLVGTLTTGQALHWDTHYFIAGLSPLLEIKHESGTNYSGTIQDIIIEAMDPINPDLIPVTG